MSARECLYHKATIVRVSSLDLSINSSLNTALDLTTPLIQNTNDTPYTTTKSSHNINTGTDININMARPSKQTKHHHRSAPRGFMEPTAGATHHEDIYGISQFEEDRAESYAFDVCDDEDDNDDDDENDDRGNIDETPSKRRRVSSGPNSGSRGVIKKPKCKSYHLQSQHYVATILTRREPHRQVPTTLTRKQSRQPPRPHLRRRRSRTRTRSRIRTRSNRPSHLVQNLTAPGCSPLHQRRGLIGKQNPRSDLAGRRQNAVSHHQPVRPEDQAQRRSLLRRGI